MARLPTMNTTAWAARDDMSVESGECSTLSRQIFAQIDRKIGQSIQWTNKQ